MRIDTRTTNFLAGTFALGICLWLATCSGPTTEQRPTKATGEPPTPAPPTETAATPTAAPPNTPSPSPESEDGGTGAPPTEDEPLADVVSVDVSGSAEDYRFSVGVASPDTGCDQYANWWEVVSTDGELLYRRILLHPHENEQPFVRSGGPVPIAADTVVIVRAHMHPTGYGGQVMRGSVEGGFTREAGDPDFAAGLADEPPGPEGCGF